ncbi:hypothetical protein AALT52_05795 [Ligilactobacillus faecis]|uniref:Uncharacterized protein n=1 Tax=Ligilactobacillus faecis TaxID=762833 RepID=A0ABV4DR97_9LACO
MRKDADYATKNNNLINTESLAKKGTPGEHIYAMMKWNLDKIQA